MVSYVVMTVRVCSSCSVGVSSVCNYIMEIMTLEKCLMVPSVVPRPF